HHSRLPGDKRDNFAHKLPFLFQPMERRCCFEQPHFLPRILTKRGQPTQTSSFVLSSFICDLVNSTLDIIRDIQGAVGTLSKTTGSVLSLTGRFDIISACKIISKNFPITRRL